MLDILSFFIRMVVKFTRFLQRKLRRKSTFKLKKHRSLHFGAIFKGNPRQKKITTSCAEASKGQR